MILTGGLAVTGCTSSSDSGPSESSSHNLESYVERGEYKVGVRAVYFHDPERPFDAWNAKHASDSYKAVLGRINDAGEPQIVPAHMWYPVDEATSAREATFNDFANSRSTVFQNAHQSGTLGAYLSTLTSSEGPLFARMGGMDSIAPIVNEANNRVINAMYQPPIAEGNFPIIIAAHGLGGNSISWAILAGYLASNGYVVVAPSFLSDSSSPNVFDSPDSKYAQSASADEVDTAYRTILGESKVIPGFYRYFFEQNASSGFSTQPLIAVPGGGDRVGEMMGEFFTQRIADVETIIDGLHSLNKGDNECASDYAGRGQSEHGNQVCGLFDESLDIEHIGIVGYSLGSMTAQFMVSSSERVVAAVGYNNGSPRYWEPPSIFGNGTSDDGQPAGASGPVMQIHGSEDAFVQSVFRGLMWNTLSAAGGNPEDIWTLEQERVLPTDENPQPIARNAYNRATGDKVIISVKDVNHDSIVNDFPSVASQDNPIVVNGVNYWSAIRPALRKAVGENVLNPQFSGELYQPLAWDTVGDTNMYMPVFIRNYYTKNWFDYYLKEDDDALRFIENPIQDKGILDIRSNIQKR